MPRDWNNLQDHHLAADFNFAKEDELSALVASIASNGFQTNLGRIMLFEGKILDGRNRYRACKAAMLVKGTKFIGFTGAEFGEFSGDDAEGYVSSAQARRNLSMADKKEYAKKLFDRHPGWDIYKVAKLAGISKSLAAEVKKGDTEAQKEKKKEDTFKKLTKAFFDLDQEVQAEWVKAYRTELTNLLQS
jgi:ParB-like chromosome segregation protein Spo0J